MSHEGRATFDTAETWCAAPLGRRAAFLGAVALLGLSLAWMGQNGPVGKRGLLFIGAYGLAFFAWLGIWRFWPGIRHQTALLWALAVGARLLMLPFPVGDDIPRYVWEGQIQHHGFNPYRLAPDAAELRHLRDANWEGINHKELAAIYPPLAQLVFRATTAVWADGRALRAVFTAADLLTLLLLALLGARLGLARRHLVLYALNPLALLYVAGEGHLDPLYLAFLAGALLAHHARRWPLVFLLLGLSAMAKVIAVLFVPLFLWRRNARDLIWFALPALLALPYLDGLAGGTMVLGRYVATFYYNGFLFSLLRPLTGHVIALPLCWLTLCVGLCAIFLLERHVLRASYLAAGLLLLTMPTVHQWYFLLAVVFLPLFRSPGWILLSGTVAATFATRITFEATGVWRDYAAARLIEYGPLVATGLFGMWRGRRLSARYLSAAALRRGLRRRLQR